MKIGQLEVLVISATSRPGANTLKIANGVNVSLLSQGVAVKLMDLAKLPVEVFHPSVYNRRPVEFESWQVAVDSSDGIVICVPEYNGSVPGIFKHFVDILRYPDTFHGKAIAIIGLASGNGGGKGAMESLTQLMKFQKAKIFPTTVLIPRCYEVLSCKGEILVSNCEN